MSELVVNSKNNIDKVIKYLNEILLFSAEKMYREMSLDDIVDSISSLNYDSDMELCDEVQELILNLGEPELCFEFARNVDWCDLNRISEVIIKSENLEINYLFLQYFEEINLKGHLNVILNSGSLEYNYLVGTLRYGFDIRPHAKIIIDSKDLWYNYNFALDVLGADVKEHGKVIINSKDLWYNYTFAKEITGCDVKAHCDVILASAEKDKYIKIAKEEGQIGLFPYLGIEIDMDKYNYLGLEMYKNIAHSLVRKK